MTKARIDAKFAALKAEGRAAFVAYVMAGDPDSTATLDILRGLPGAGADLIELGFPFSDPMAEGLPIQRAAQRALVGGMTLRKTLDLVRSFRNPLIPADAGPRTLRRAPRMRPKTRVPASAGMSRVGRNLFLSLTQNPC